MNKKFFKENRKKLMNKLENGTVVILFGGKAPHKSADDNYNFTPNRNFYYLTGIPYENVVAVLEKMDDKITETLFIEPSDPVASKWVGERMGEEEALNRSDIINIEYVDKFEAVLHKLFNDKGYNTLYLDLERRDYSEVGSYAHKFGKSIVSKYPYIKIQNAYPVICALRKIKENEEVEKIEKAIEITTEGVKNIMKNAKPGMFEFELEAYFDFVLKSKGVKDYAFNTIAASGKNATVLHYSQNNSQTKDKELVLFDLGAQFEYYSADITRTFPVNGVFTSRQREIYDIVLKAQSEVIAMIKPGIPFKALNERCREVLTQECKKIKLIQSEEELSEYYFHGVSHFLGLDTHDVGLREGNLEPGMVITVEPGLYIPEEEIGIRIEDDVLVTEEGAKILSGRFLTSADDIEEFMKQK